MRTILCTALALTAFAANSVLCRLALADGAIDAATFSMIRLASGAGTLLLLSVATGRVRLGAGSWPPAGVLFLYAVAFSFAYIRLTTGTGALILFAAVQLTMFVAALSAGERPATLQWAGLGLALSGLLYLVRPGLAAPAPEGAVLMTVAGIAWGVYSLLGRHAAHPLALTTGNFVRAVPLALFVNLLALPQFHLELRGALLAMVSGSLASGVGYVLWYMALGGLTATRAAVVQLAVPVLAAAGGVVLLAEPVSLRLVLATAMVLGGIALVLRGRERAAHQVTAANGPAGAAQELEGRGR
jgi:drug/metabolite transporter (DMT)-like permease